MTLELRPETVGALAALAHTRGLSVEEYIDALIRRESTEGLSLPAALSAEEWVRELKTWASSHSGLPVLTDEAMSREFTYADRGL
jgi:hypothetical protein